MNVQLRYIFVMVMLVSTISIGHAQQRVIKYDGGRKTTVIKADSTFVTDSLKMTDSLTMADSTKLKPVAALPAVDTVKKAKEHKKFRLIPDSLSAGTVTLMSFIPGVGQAYNKQYWKIPVTYGLIGGFVAGGLVTDKSYKKSKLEWQRTVDLNLPQSIQDHARGKMEQQGATKTVFYGLAVATYLYQVADATFNYRGKVDHIRKATTLAAIFPGAGFIYTRTYWRLPIYYGGFITLATVVDYNNRNYQRYSKAYNDLTDKDPTTIDEFNGRFAPDMLQNARNQYRRNRDLGIIAIVGAYILSIVDTHVIASLKNWDISPDLSMVIEPTIIDNSRPKLSSVPTGAGLSLKLKF